MTEADSTPNEPPSSTDESTYTNPGWLQRWSRETVFWVNVGFASLVLVVALIFAIYEGRLEGMFLIGVPLSVVWFGMLGALLCSLQGIIEHNEDYDRRYNYWHLARPLIGGIVGLMSFLFLTVIVTLGGGAKPDLSAAPTAAGLNLYHVAAFIVGYREDAFRDLVSRVTDLVLRPGTPRASDDRKSKDA